MTNRNVVLLPGKSATGKTASLRNLRNPKGVLYCCAEAGKELPFASQFTVLNLASPLELPTLFTKAATTPKFHTIVIDSLDYLMDMYESQIVLTSNNTMQGWQDYQQYFKALMQTHVAQSKMNVIFTGHTMDVLNENEGVMENFIKVKGSLMNHGIESYFNNIIGCKKVPLKWLEGQSSPLLNITEEETELGFKYVYQTRLTKRTVNERIRGPLGMWSPKEIYIDNDLQNVLDRLQAYYNPSSTADTQQPIKTAKGDLNAAQPT